MLAQKRLYRFFAEDNDSFSKKAFLFIRTALHRPDLVRHTEFLSVPFTTEDYQESYRNFDGFSPVERSLTRTALRRLTTQHPKARKVLKDIPSANPDAEELVTALLLCLLPNLRTLIMKYRCWAVDVTTSVIGLAADAALPMLTHLETLEMYCDDSLEEGSDYLHDWESVFRLPNISTFRYSKAFIVSDHLKESVLLAAKDLIPSREV